MATPLSACIPNAISAVITQILAFPTSLAALKPPVIRWNASCWVADRRLDPFEEFWINQLAFPGQERTPHLEWCHFASDDSSRVSLCVVFPNLKTSFRSLDVMEKWTDHIVIPAFRKNNVSAGILSTSFNVIKLTGEAEREETLNVNAPDTALREVLVKKGGIQSEDLVGIWNCIEETANTNAFWGFRDLFLVAVYHNDASVNTSLSLEQSWNSACSAWDTALDMNYILVESVRAHSAVAFGAASAEHAVPQWSPVSPQRPEFRSTPSDTARKRRIEASEDISKRSRVVPGPRPLGKCAQSHSLS
jgi:hypothetical protein